MDEGGYPTAVMWRLGGDPDRLPPPGDGYPMGYLTRRAALGAARRLFGPDRLPPCLHGHELRDGRSVGATRDPRHPNAHFLAEDGGGGRIDRVLIVAAGGFDGPALAALAMVDRLYDGARGEWPVRMVWAGPAAEAPSRLTGESRVWVSATPWFRPLHDKPGRTVESLLRRDLTHRGWPEPERAEPLSDVPAADGRRLGRADFVARLPARADRARPDAVGCLWRLTFAQPVRGPLAAGWDCHLGLGLFRPDPAFG